MDRPAEVRELRELTRYRQKLVSLRASCKDQVVRHEALYYRAGMKGPRRRAVAAAW